MSRYHFKDTFQCGDCTKFIYPHLRNILCFKCNIYFHVQCCNINIKQFNFLKSNGENWLCVLCRHNRNKIKCKACKKTISKNNVNIHCSECGNFFHSKCSKISVQEFERLASWNCNSCIAKCLPFSAIENDVFSITMEARELNFGEHVSLYPSFTIRSLLENIRGNSDNEDYVHDLTHSKYYTTSEFTVSKIPKDSFSMFHINIASLSLHLDDLKMLLSTLNHPFDVIAVSETKIKEGIEPVTIFFYRRIQLSSNSDKI